MATPLRFGRGTNHLVRLTDLLRTTTERQQALPVQFEKRLAHDTAARRSAPFLSVWATSHFRDKAQSGRSGRPLRYADASSRRCQSFQAVQPGQAQHDARGARQAGSKCERAPGNFWEKYFEPEILPTLKYSTCQLYRFLSSKHLLPALGDQKLCEVARFQVQQFIGNKQRQGYSPQTLRHFRNLLGKMFGTAQRWGWMESNPAHQIDLPPMSRRFPKRVLTPEQLFGLSSFLDEPVRTIVFLGVLTGLRVGELLALEVEDVDLTYAMVSVLRDVYHGRVGTPKTPGSERQIPLAAPLIQMLDSWLRLRPSGSAWLFPSLTGTPLRDRNLMRRHLWPACEKLGIPRFGWHSLRHTFSTYNGNAGVPMPVLQSLLGHSSPETTMLYTHPLEDAKRQAVEHLARLLFPNVPSKAVPVVAGNRLLN